MSARRDTTVLAGRSATTSGTASLSNSVFEASKRPASFCPEVADMRHSESVNVGYIPTKPGVRCSSHLGRAVSQAAEDPPRVEKPPQRVGSNGVLPVEYRFWSRVERRGDCWIWTGAKSSAGYGTFCRKATRPPKSELCHRVSWEWANGPIPDGLCLRHTCHTPLCVRPSYLTIGTHQDNMRDRDEAGRTLRGESHPRTKYSDADIIAMREAWGRRDPVAVICARFGVPQATLLRIVHGKGRSYLPLGPKRPYGCALCGQGGHNSRTCLARAEVGHAA